MNVSLDDIHRLLGARDIEIFVLGKQVAALQEELARIKQEPPTEEGDDGKGNANDG